MNPTYPPRAFRRIAAWLAAFGACAGAATSPAASDAEQRVTRWLQAWDAQGLHRTATEGDEAGAAWLSREAQAIAGPVASESFTIQRIDPAVARVEFDGQRLEGLVLFEGAETPPEGVRAKATLVESDHEIVVLPVAPSIVYGPEWARMRRASKAPAQIVVTMGGSPGLAPLNAESFRSPFGPPTVQISSVDRDRVMAALNRGTEFRVTVRYQRTAAPARNVLLTIPGRDRGRPPVVVMTPRSSWWQSTSERGGGLVCWLEALRAVKASPPGCDVVFTATSGHELGHVGLDDFVARRPGWETRATWIHFGASIGAAGSRLTIQSNQEDLRALAVRHLTAAGEKNFTLADRNQVPTGETRDIHRAGGRYLTIGAPPASNAVFHLPQDRWPDSADVPAIARIAAASAAAIAAVTR